MSPVLDSVGECGTEREDREGKTERENGPGDPFYGVSIRLCDFSLSIAEYLVVKLHVVVAVRAIQELHC